MKILVVVLTLLIAVYSEETIKTVDFFGTVCEERAIQIKRVQKLVNVTYSYALQTTQKWQQFPDMNITFQIDHSQFVRVKYHISMRTYSNELMLTRVLIDGKDNPFFRYVTGYLYWRTHTVSHEVYMEKGKHTVIVQYDQRGGNYNMEYWDWTAALFQIEYFQY